MLYVILRSGKSWTIASHSYSDSNLTPTDLLSNLAEICLWCLPYIKKEKKIQTEQVIKTEKHKHYSLYKHTESCATGR